jgi:hypothetical protein
MSPGSKPVFPFKHGELQFLGLSLRGLTKIAALHGLLVGGTDLSAEEAADYARRAADALYPQPAEPERAINVRDLVAQMAAEAETDARRPGKKRAWRLW